MQQPTYYPPILAERYPVAFLAGLFEIALVILGSHIAHFFRFDDWSMPSWYAVGTLIIALVVMICQLMLNTYSSWRGRQFFRQLGHVYSGWLIALAILTILAVFFKVSDTYSRIWLSTTLLISLALVTLFRLSIFLFLRRLRLHGKNLKNVLVVESGTSADELRSKYHELPENGYHVVKNIKLMRNDYWLDDLVADAAATRAHEVWLCLPLQEGEAIKTILHALRHLTVEVRYLPDLGDIPLLNHRISDIVGLYALDISCTPMEGSARLIKRTEDLIIGGAISLIILPVCILIALAIKISSPGPIIFKQYRMGINGRKFKVYKFRSMAVHQETADTVTQATQGDPRVTRIGAFLRKTSLDELPQFYNVLQGRMSIVGPRPHALAHNEYYKELVESYMKRHKVKPGITGWAQVNGFRGETDTLEKMQKRVECDLWYINSWSLALDLKIIYRTIYKGFINNNP